MWNKYLTSLCIIFSRGSDRSVHSDRGRDTDRDSGRKRSRSHSKDRDGDTNPKRKRKRPSRWSDHPPSPRRDDGDNNNNSNINSNINININSNNTNKDDRDSDRWRDRLVDRPPPDEPVVGDIYNGKISSIMQFGCFVQLEGLRLVDEMSCLHPFTPKQQEMCHFYLLKSF